MKFESWYLIMGALLVVVALAGSVVKRLPLTTTMIYLGIGMALGPLGFGIADMDPFERSAWLERMTELAVIVSLFTAGLKLGTPIRLKTWAAPLRLAFLSMALTVGMVTLVGVFVFHWPVGAAVLLGAVLAPTDPVLASDVQLESSADRDTLRLRITGEAGLNDGTAFPFVMLGLGLMGLHEIGEGGWRWFTVDVLWAIAGGLGIGWVLGAAVAHLALYLRRAHKEGFGRDEFLALGLIALAYGLALLLHTYGFLAVFAAGLALRAVEHAHTGAATANAIAQWRAAESTPHAVAYPEKAPTQMAGAVLAFNEQLERILEVGLVLLLGTMLSPDVLRLADLWFVPVLLLLIRPVAVQLGLAGSSVPRKERRLISWFGIRGIGSVYYLMYAIERGVPAELARQMISLTFWVIACSIVVHGISVTPLMNWYDSRRGGSRSRR